MRTREKCTQITKTRDLKLGIFLRSLQPRTGMKTLDRGLLIFIWSMAVMYGMMCEQIVVNTPSQTCEVRQGLASIYGIVSLSFVLIIPTVFGPLSVLVLYTISRFLDKKDEQSSTERTEREDARRTTCLTVVFLIVYINTMVLCELWQFTKDNIFSFVLGIIASFSTFLISKWCL